MWGLESTWCTVSHTVYTHIHIWIWHAYILAVVKDVNYKNTHCANMYGWVCATFMHTYKHAYSHLVILNARIVCCFCKRLKIARLLFWNCCANVCVYACVCVKHALICTLAKTHTYMHVWVYQRRNLDSHRVLQALVYRAIVPLIMCHMHNLLCLFTNTYIHMYLQIFYFQ